MSGSDGINGGKGSKPSLDGSTIAYRKTSTKDGMDYVRTASVSGSHTRQKYYTGAGGGGGTALSFDFRFNDISESRVFRVKHGEDGTSLEKIQEGNYFSKGGDANGPNGTVETDWSGKLGGGGSGGYKGGGSPGGNGFVVIRMFKKRDQK